MQLPGEIGNVISAWSIGQLTSFRLVNRGVVNHNFILRTSKGKYVLRQVSHAHHKSTRDLEFEIAYLDYLKHARFPYSTPLAIPTIDGSLFVTVQSQYYWLYRFLEGGIIERLKEPHLTQLAKMMAQYHLLIERSELNNGKPASDPYNRTSTLKEIEEYRAEILRTNENSPQERTFLEESARLTPILRGFDDDPWAQVRMYPIHRDLISENLLWRRGKLVGVIDFEHVSGSNDPIVKDIAVTIQYCCRDSAVKHQLDIDSATRFLRAYRKSHPLSDREVALIPNLITAGFVDDFAFAFWMIRNDPKRAKRSEEEGYGLTLFSRAALWSHSNRERIAQAFLNERLSTNSKGQPKKLKKL